MSTGGSERDSVFDHQEGLVQLVSTVMLLFYRKECESPLGFRAGTCTHARSHPTHPEGGVVSAYAETEGLQGLQGLSEISVPSISKITFI